MRTRQAILVEPGRFEIEIRDISPAENEMVVKMSAVGLCNWELGHWSGKIGAPPMTLGHEGCGTVVEAGKAVTRFKVGDRVTGLPDNLVCFADYFLLRDAMTMLINDAPEPELTLGEPIVCVQNVVRTARPQAGDVVAITGCGPMGLWCVQNLAGNISGALVGVDLDPAKLDLAKKFGATNLINPGKENAVETLHAQTGRPADIVIEGTGSAKGVELAINLLKPGGHLVVMSSFKDAIPVDVVQCCSKYLRIDFAHPGIFSDMPDSLLRAEATINRGVYSFKPLVSHTFRLENIQQAFETLEHKPADYLKGVVVP